MHLGHRGLGEIGDGDDAHAHRRPCDACVSRGPDPYHRDRLHRHPDGGDGDGVFACPHHHDHDHDLQAHGHHPHYVVGVLLNELVYLSANWLYRLTS